MSLNENQRECETVCLSHTCTRCVCARVQGQISGNVSVIGSTWGFKTGFSQLYRSTRKRKRRKKKKNKEQKDTGGEKVEGKDEKEGVSSDEDDSTPDREQQAQKQILKVPQSSGVHCRLSLFTKKKLLQRFAHFPQNRGSQEFETKDRISHIEAGLQEESPSSSKVSVRHRHF